MARRKSSNPFDDAGEDPKMNIGPLIDVAFLLLIYFIVTMTLQKEESDLSLVLPGVASVESKPVKVDQMLIKITPEAAILVNEELIEADPDDRRIATLTDRLTRYAASAKIAGSEAMVVIDCDDEAPQQRFVDVLNACATADLKNVSLTQ